MAMTLFNAEAIFYAASLPLSRASTGTVRLTTSEFVGRMALSERYFGPFRCDDSFWSARMWHHSSIVDSRRGQLFAPEA
jgi:hypothetical protein